MERRSAQILAKDDAKTTSFCAQGRGRMAARDVWDLKLTTKE